VGLLWRSYRSSHPLHVKRGIRQLSTHAGPGFIVHFTTPTRGQPLPTDIRLPFGGELQQVCAHVL